MDGTNGAGRPATPAYSAAAARAAADRALRGTRRFVLRKDQAGLVERLARTGRLRLRRTEGEDDPPTVRWDDGPPWRFCLDVRAEVGGKRWSWRGSLRRGDADRMDLAEPLVLVPGLLDPGRRPGRPVRRPGRHALDPPAPPREGDRLRRAPAGPDARPHPGRDAGAAAELVETLNLEEIDVKPRPCLTLRTPRQNWGIGADKLLAELEFDYDGAVIPAGRTTPLAVSTELGLVDPPRPADRERGRRQALRAGLPRGEGPAARPRHDGAAGQAAGAGDQGPGRSPAGGSRPRAS